MLPIATVIVLLVYVALYQTGKTPDTCWTEKSKRRIRFVLTDYRGCAQDKYFAQAVGYRLLETPEYQELPYKDYLDFVILYTDIHTDTVRYFPFCCKYSRRRLKAISAKIQDVYHLDLPWKDLRRIVKHREYQNLDQIQIQAY